MSKRRIIIIFVLGILILFMTTLGIVLMREYNKEKNAVIKVNLKNDLTAEFLSEVKVSDFIENINGKIKDDYLIDTKSLGEKEIKFTYINDDGVKVKRSFKINVVDTVPPVIWLSNSYTVNVNSNIDLAHKIMCGDNYDSHPKCEVIGDYDINKVGTYPLVYKATDNSGNVSEINFNLNVVKPSNSSSNNRKHTLFSEVIKKYKNEDTEIGLDLSEWQDYPDYNKLKESGVEFVFLRVGGTKYSTGDYFVDKSFQYNVEKANEVGIPVGVYFYSYAKNKDEALKDAEWIYKQIKDYNVELGVAFDWENWSFYNDFGLSFYELTDMATSHLKFFKDKGYKAYLYSSKSYLEEIWLKHEYPVWLAHYTKDLNESSYEGEYTYWQLCNNGVVDGVNGDVDINIRYKK